MTKEMDQASLYKDRAFVQDDWVIASEDQNLADLGEGEKTFISFEKAIGLLESGRNMPAVLGVIVSPGDAVEDLEPYLGQIAAIAVEFPAFTDGRGFSSARLLRERFGFTGEIRAFGAYMLDQMPMMERCGIDAFVVGNERLRAGLERGEWPVVSNYYQPTAAEGNKLIASRPWLRQRGN